MYIESEAIFLPCLSYFVSISIPSLPVFDSLMVPKDNEAIASSVLSKAYEAKVGIRPALKVE